MIVFLDMDGVVADFAAGVANLFGLPLDEVEAAGDRTYKVLGLSKAGFYERLEAAGPEWWAGLPVYPWANRLAAACGAVGEVYIATSPQSGCVSAGTGKLAWIKAFLPDAFAGRRFFIGTDKHLLAAPGRVLIDDDPKKCDAFRAAGGRAVLFPRPWNMDRQPPGATPEGLIEGIERSGDFDGHPR